MNSAGFRSNNGKVERTYPIASDWTEIPAVVCACGSNDGLQSECVDPTSACDLIEGRPLPLARLIGANANEHSNEFACLLSRPTGPRQVETLVMINGNFSSSNSKCDFPGMQHRHGAHRFADWLQAYHASTTRKFGKPGVRQEGIP